MNYMQAIFTGLSDMLIGQTELCLIIHRWFFGMYVFRLALANPISFTKSPVIH